MVKSFRPFRRSAIFQPCRRFDRARDRVTVKFDRKPFCRVLFAVKDLIGMCAAASLF